MSAPVFDVNALEREGAPEPFEFVLGPRKFVMGDPHEMVFDEILAILVEMAKGQIVAALSKMLPEGDRKEFQAEARKIPVFKLNGLSKAFRDHYGMNLPESGASLLS